MKILVENFEALAKIKLNLAPGTITSITGSNGQGKSSVVRALDSMIKNRPASDKESFIRKGASKARVLIKGSDDKVIKWARTTSATTLSINNKPETKLRRQSIPEIDPECGYAIEKDPGGAIIPNIVHEETKIFPFNVSTSTAFKIFNRFLGVGKLEDMLNEQKAILKKAKSQRKKQDGVVDTYDFEIQNLSDEKSKMPNVEHLSEVQYRIIELNKEYTKLNLACKSIENDIERYKSYVLESKKCSKLLESITIWMDKYGADLVEYTRLTKALHIVEEMISKYERYTFEIKQSEAFVNYSFIEVEKMVLEYDILHLLLEQYEHWSEAQKTLELKETEYARIVAELKTVDFCPLCKREF